MRPITTTRTPAGTRRAAGRISKGVLSSFLLLALVCFPVDGGAQGLSLIGADNGTISIVVPESGIAPLEFHHTEAAAIGIDVGTFVSSGEQVATVAVGLPGDADSGTGARIEFPQDVHRATLELRAENLEPGIKYSGILTASWPAGTKRWTATIYRPSPLADVETDLGKRELDLTICGLTYSLCELLGLAEATKTVSVAVFEATGAAPIRGLTVRRAAGSESSAGIDLLKNFSFRIDGTAMPNMTKWPEPDSALAPLRDIAADGQRTLSISVVDLPRGEHKLMLELDAINAKPGSNPKIDLTVRVRHQIEHAIVLLFAATVLSIFITRVIVNWRQRLALLERARLLKREWLQGLRELAPVVWLKATRRQAEITLGRLTIAAAPDELVDRLEKAARLLTLLGRYRDLQDHLDRRNLPYMENWRLQREIDGIVSSIEPELLDDANLATIRTEFDTFQQALADPVSLYRPLVLANRRTTRHAVSRPWLEGLLTEIKAEKKTRAHLEKLLQVYVEAEPPDNPDETQLVILDRVCSSLRVLRRHWDDGDKETVQELVKLIAQDKAESIQIDRVFELTNVATWDRVVKDVKAKNLRVTPGSATSPIVALTPTRFAITLDDEKLNDRFLFKSRMTADWSFSLQPKPKRPWKWPFKIVTPEADKWPRRAKGRTIVQFAPQAGALSFRAVLRFDKRKCDPISGQTEVLKSQRSRIARLVEKGELVLWVVSLAIALVSGLVLYYVPKPTFGSLQDYLALFTWGIGVDQGKNLVQTMQSLRSQSQTDSAGQT